MDRSPSLPPATLSASLQCHPALPSAAVEAVEVRLAWCADGALALDYVLTGALDRVRLPTPAAPAPADRLWAHTCCEVFIAAKGETRYREFNFSPSGQWAAYDFDRYRQRSAGTGYLAAPRIESGHSAGRLTLSALVAAEALGDSPAALLQLGLSVVVEEEDGSLAYWALRHPGPRPDFHHRDAFALELARPRSIT